MAIRGCVLRWWKPPGVWCVFSPIIDRCSSGEKRCVRERSLQRQRVRKPSWQWPANWRLICGESAPAAPLPSKWAFKENEVKQEQRGTKKGDHRLKHPSKQQTTLERGVTPGV